MSKKKNRNIMNTMNSLQLTNELYNYYKQMIMSRFKWSNLPEGLTPQYLEETLFYNGQILFFNDINFGLLALRCTPQNYNIYGLPISFIAHGLNYTNTINKEMVLIKNNLISGSSSDYIYDMCRKIAELDKTIEINMCNQKTPYMIATNRDNELSVRNIYNQINSNEPCLFIDKSNEDNSLTLIDTHVQFKGKELSELRHEYINQILTYCGINNTNVSKRERMVVDEVNSNNVQINANINMMLECRQIAVDEINKTFGTNISVEIDNSLESEYIKPNMVTL